jgi:hypothetical protein
VRASVGQSVVVLVAVAGFVFMLACSMRAVTSARRMTGMATGRAPVKDRGPGQQAACLQGPAAWPAGGIGANGAAGGALAAPPARRPLNPWLSAAVSLTAGLPGAAMEFG